MCNNMVNQNQKAQESGSGLNVEDFNVFCDGDTELTLNKKIRSLIESEKNYIVYIDDELTVNGRGMMLMEIHTRICRSGKQSWSS